MRLRNGGVAARTLAREQADHLRADRSPAEAQKAARKRRRKILAAVSAVMVSLVLGLLFDERRNWLTLAIPVGVGIFAALSSGWKEERRREAGPESAGLTR